MEVDGGGGGDDDNNACVVYNDRANENATKALPEGGVQGGGNFRTQSTIKLELGMEKGGGRMCKNDDDYNDETRRKKYITTNHKQWKDATWNRGGERWR